MSAAAVRALVPEAPLALLVVSLAAWVLLVAMPPALAIPLLCASGAGDWATLSAGVTMTLALNPLPQLFASSLLMLCAMMLPFAHAPLGRAGRGAVAPFLAGYLGVWLAAILVLQGAALLLRLVAGSETLTPLVLGAGIACLWQGTRLKARCLARSLASRPPSPDMRAALVLGAGSGAACICSCWALMLLPFLAGQAHVAAMGCVTVLMILDRRRAQVVDTMGKKDCSTL